MIKGNHANCSLFASSKRLDWLLNRLESQESSTGTPPTRTAPSPPLSPAPSPPPHTASEHPAPPLHWWYPPRSAWGGCSSRLKWRRLLRYVLAAMIKGSRDNCKQFGSSTRINWLISKLADQGSFGGGQGRVDSTAFLYFRSFYYFRFSMLLKIIFFALNQCRDLVDDI